MTILTWRVITISDRLLFMKTAILLITLCFMILPSFAGPRSSGGGTSVVCRDPQTHKIIGSPELYELFEAENDPRINAHIPRSKKEVKTQIDSILSGLESRSTNGAMDVLTMRNSLALVDRDWTPTGGSVSITMVPDFVPRFFPKDPRCKLEVTAYYDDLQSVLFVDREIYGRMTNTDKAALKLHEAAYKVNRIFAHDQDSDRTREMVAALLTGQLTWFYRNLGALSRPAELPPLNTSMLDLVFGGKSLICGETGAASELRLRMKNSNLMVGADLSTLPWAEQSFHGNFGTSLLSVNTESDEFNTSISFSVADLISVLKGAQESFKARYSFDGSSDLIDGSPNRALKCMFR